MENEYLSFLIILIGLLVSKPGRRLIYGWMANYISGAVNTGKDLDGDGIVDMTFEGLTHDVNPDARKEDYVTRFFFFLLFCGCCTSLYLFILKPLSTQV